MKQGGKYIGFPGGMLGEEGVRLKVLYEDEEVIALEKPRGVLIDEHPFYVGRRHIIGGIREQVERGKGELERMGIKDARSVFHLDKEIEGMGLIGKTKEGGEVWRNYHGSSQIRFVYEFLARRSEEVKEEEFICDLGIGVSKEEGRNVISGVGKRHETLFRRKGVYGKYELWEAEVMYNRMHQVRVHAWQRGLIIPGEEVYHKTRCIEYGELGRMNKPKEDGVIWPSLHCILKKLEVRRGEGEALEIWSEVGRGAVGRWGVLLKLLGVK